VLRSWALVFPPIDSVYQTLGSRVASASPCVKLFSCIKQKNHHDCKALEKPCSHSCECFRGDGYLCKHLCLLFNYSILFLSTFCLHQIKVLYFTKYLIVLTIINTLPNNITPSLIHPW
jgi:hypothetical protein